ncbi:MAG: nickel pincer cofactor biosynthesis protein LarC [Proteobacteria bacterium]|nr:nickel pincer cofactor biosynthesis protein LarC [Pseudomonadota bacterium]
MKALYYQPSCGIAGDMHMAAMVDLGMPQPYLDELLAKLPLQDEFALSFEAASKMGISGLHANVTTSQQTDHRHHSTIVRMIEEADLPAAITTRALDMFGLIAAAEGKIHNVSPDKVHFHEVGALDSIVDIVAAAAAIEYFQPDIIICDAVEVGSGFVNCAHGRLPVPAPATQEILAAVPCRYGSVDGEATTPTGAAILANAVSEFIPKGVFTPQTIGYGVGSKDFGIANVLRVALGSYEPRQPNTLGDLGRRFADLQTDHFQIEANIDDMSPEAFAPLQQALFDAGAVDVFTQPIMMKKQRPAQRITALCDDEHLKRVSDTLLNHSTSIGLRILPFAKRVLPRVLQRVTTRMGEVNVKITTAPNGLQRFKVEHDDIVQLAAEQSLDYLTAQRLINEDISRELGDRT